MSRNGLNDVFVQSPLLAKFNANFYVSESNPGCFCFEEVGQGGPIQQLGPILVRKGMQQSQDAK